MRKQERGLINCLKLNIYSDFFSFEGQTSLKFFNTDVLKGQKKCSSMQALPTTGDGTAHCISIVQQKALSG